LARLSVHLPASALLGGLAAVLATAALAPVGPFRMALFAAASGIGPFSMVRSRWRASELLMAPLGMSLLLWAVLGMILGRPPLRGLAPWAPTVVAAGLAVVARRWPRRIELELSALDAAPMLAAGLAAIPIAMVFAHNGPQGDQYVAREWFTHDSFYLFGLAQESIERGGWPPENPFLAGVANYYPSFLHVGLGALARQGDPTVAFSIVWLAPFFLVASVGLWVVACVRVTDTRSLGTAALTSAVALVGVAGAFALRPDLFSYPHTQAFALGWLALMLWLGADPLDSASTAAAGVVALALVLAHVITGEAAVVSAAATALSLLAARRTRRRGLWLAGGTLALASVFWWMNVPPYGGPRRPVLFSWIAGAAPSLSPWLWPMIGLALYLASSWRKPARALPALVTVGFGAAYCVYGSSLSEWNERAFVLFNTQRFFLVGLLLGLTAAMRGDRRIGLAAALLVAASAFYYPTDLATRFKGLLDAPPLVVDASDLRLFDRIRTELPVDARILTPANDYALPAFTGRAQSPQYESQGNLWGLNTLPGAEFAERLGDTMVIPRLPPAEWPALLDRWGYSHVLVRVLGSEGKDPGTAERWMEMRLPAELTIEIAEGNRFLIGRRSASFR